MSWYAPNHELPLPYTMIAYITRARKYIACITMIELISILHKTKDGDQFKTAECPKYRVANKGVVSEAVDE
jgi:hypothetical protein